MEQEKQKQLRVLVGDDDLGIEGSLQHRSFLRNYGRLAHFDFIYNADDFIQRAKTEKYDAFLIDLNWEEDDSRRDYKTGFRVLEAVKDYAPIRVLHTSDDKFLQRGFQYGATHCLEKFRPSSLLEKILKEVKKNEEKSMNYKLR